VVSGGLSIHMLTALLSLTDPAIRKRIGDYEMKTALMLLLISILGIVGPMGSEADVPFLDEFTTFDTNVWTPYSSYPSTCVASAADGRSVIYISYGNGGNSGIKLASVPIQPGSSATLTVVFKPIGDTRLVVRVTDALNPSGYLYISTEFWGTTPNNNLIGVYDRKNRINYLSPTRLWISSPSPDNWLTYQFAMGSTTSLASVKDSFGKVLWQSGTITNAGTSNLPNGMCVSIYGDYSVEGNGPVEVCIDKVIVTDDYVADPDLTNIAECKQQPDLTRVSPGGIVTQVSDGFFYIENPGRTSGIRVEQNPNERCVGDKLDAGNLVGTMDTLPSGERCIQASQVDWSGGFGDVTQLGMNNRTIGGGSFGDVMGGSGQVGVSGCEGLNNIGLLIRTWGKVIQLEPVATQTWFSLDDGSGVILRVLVAAGTSAPAADSIVKVSGVVSCEKDTNGNIQRLILTRDSNDVQAL